MKIITTKQIHLIRILCILCVATLGLATITGSGDGDGSSTDYETFLPTINFDTIRIVFDANDPDQATVSCTPYTSIYKEFHKLYPDETRDLTIVGGTIDAVEAKYKNAVWLSLSEEPITCESSIDGSLGDGPLDDFNVDSQSSEWSPVQNPSVLTNYITTDPKAEFRICVQCLNNNLFTSYTLDYLSRTDLTLTVRETDQEESTE